MADADLTSAFNKKFGLSVKPEVVARLLGSPHVRAWYAEYRETRAAASSLPDHWSEAGLTATEWAAVQTARSARTAARARAQAALAAAAERYKAECAAINAEAELELRQHSEPLVLATEGGYEQLSLAAQTRIETAAAGEREGQLKAELATARKAWVKAARGGSAPF